MENIKPHFEVNPNIESFNKLKDFLKDNLDDTVTMSFSHYSKGISLTKENGEIILDASLHDTDDISNTLFTLFNHYKNTIEIGDSEKFKYHEPYTGEQNTTTSKSIQEASFILKDLLEDIKPKE